MTPRQGRVVEFFGYSGSGKSTMCSHALEALRALGMAADALNFAVHEVSIARITVLMSQMMLGPAYAWRSLKEFVSSQQRSVRDFQWVYRTWLERSYLIRAHARRPGIHLVEEGLFQALWSMALSSTKPDLSKEMSALCAIAPLPSGVVIVEASVESIAKRLADRQRQGRIEHWLRTNPKFHEYASKRLYEVSQLVEETSSRAGIAVLRVRNETPHDLDVNRSKVLEFLLSGPGGL